MKNMDIEKILIESLGSRGIFHSEADFQHYFAWAIQSSFHKAAIRLEYPLSKNEKNKWEYCDIFIRHPEKIGIELKYKTKLQHHVVNGETFELKNQGAQDLGRYDFLKDISRLENWCSRGIISHGYAIMLSNDQTYWKSPVNKTTVDREFRIHNREISGELSWESHASAGTMKGRESSIILKNNYDLTWIASINNGFSYIVVKVNANK